MASPVAGATMPTSLATAQVSAPQAYGDARPAANGASGLLTTPTTLGNPATAPAAAPAPNPTALQYGANVTPLTGQETPTSITPAPNPAVTGLSTALTSEAQRQLAQPTVYDDPLYHQVTAAQKQGVDDRSRGRSVAQQRARAARPGLLERRRRPAQRPRHGARARAGERRHQVSAQRAQALASGRTASFNNASSAVGTQAALDQNYLNNLTNERSYEDTLRNTAYGQNVQQTELGLQQQSFQQQQYQQLLSTALGYGQGATGASLMQGAGAALGVGANAYNNQAQGTSSELAQLAQLLGRANGWGLPTQNTGGLSVPTGYGATGGGDLTVPDISGWLPNLPNF